MNIPCHDDFHAFWRRDEEIAVLIDIDGFAGKGLVDGCDRYVLAQHAGQGPPFGQDRCEPLTADGLVQPFDFLQQRFQQGQPADADAFAGKTGDDGLQILRQVLGGDARIDADAMMM